MNIEAVKKSYQNPNKNKNGDFCEFKVLEEEELIVLALADGVGSNPCDWKASQVSCTKFIEEFGKSSKEDISERFIEAVNKINQALIATAGSCKGMKSTFCGVVWDIKNAKIYYTNIGDSRIYQCTFEEAAQISTDEVKSVILRKKDGKPMTVSGVAIVAEGVTNVIGSEALTFEIKTKSDEGVKAFVLSTDGFHGISSNFEKDTLEVINSITLENSLDTLYQKYRDSQKDDMTILVLRKLAEENNYQTVVAAILNDKDISSINNLELSKALLIGIEDGIKEKDFNKLVKLLDAVDKNSIDFGRENIGNLMALMSQVGFLNGEVYQLLLAKMRNSKL